MHKGKETKIHWHPAFIEAIKMELKPYLDKIEIIKARRTMSPLTTSTRFTRMPAFIQLLIMRP